MLAKLMSFGLNGLNGYPINVEVDMHTGVPACDIVGLADTAVKEAKERVRLAIRNSGFGFPIGKIVVNLAPADTKKEGSLYDLAMAIGMLAASEQLSCSRLKNKIFLGELSLDGELRRVNGILPIIISAKQQGYDNIIIPYGNKEEAQYIEGLNIYAAHSLTEVYAYLSGAEELERLGKVFGVCVHAAELARIITREPVLALREALGEPLYRYGIQRGQYQLGSVRQFFLSRDVREPLLERMQRHGRLAIAICRAPWPAALKERAAENIEDAPPSVSPAVQRAVWFGLKKLLLKEVAPQWAPCFD